MGISIGAHGALCASTATVMIEDRIWELSAAGRAADAQTPSLRSTPRPHREPRGVLPVPGSMIVAAHLVHRAMREIRVIRYPSHVGRIPIQALCCLLDRAGSAVMAAGTHRLPKARDAACRRLVERWCEQGPPDLAGWTATRMRDTATQSPLTARTRSWIQTLASHLDAAPAPGPQARGPLPEHAELRLARYTAAHTRYDVARPAAVVVNLAVPPLVGDPAAEPWGLRAAEFTEVGTLRLATAAFNGPGPVHLQGPLSARTVALHDGALALQGTDITR